MTKSCRTITNRQWSPNKKKQTKQSSNFLSIVTHHTRDSWTEPATVKWWNYQYAMHVFLDECERVNNMTDKDSEIVVDDFTSK